MSRAKRPPVITDEAIRDMVREGFGDPIADLVTDTVVSALESGAACLPPTFWLQVPRGAMRDNEEGRSILVAGHTIRLTFGEPSNRLRLA